MEHKYIEKTENKDEITTPGRHDILFHFDNE
jgi:hypothetical protein